MRGAVKTRLAADIGKDGALAFYRRTLHDVLWRLGRDPRWQTWLAVTPDSAVRDAALWPPVDRVRRIGQGQGDLGARMARPFRTLPPGPVVIVGSDIPDVSPDHIRDAFVYPLEYPARAFRHAGGPAEILPGGHAGRAG
jgi:glycosyltransferase A (GT-A) superfamily protein (DUF2064 family)